MTDNGVPERGDDPELDKLADEINRLHRLHLVQSAINGAITRKRRRQERKAKEGANNVKE